jgi:hypothetical protein
MTAMTQKIKEQKEWPFFQAYHDSNYILRHDCSKDVPLREQKEKRTYRLHNKSEKELVVYKIDGGLINNDNVLKCDNAIYTEDDWLFLIELKGTDLNQALDQIDRTIDRLLKQPNIKVQKLNVRIVVSKVSVPRMYASKEKKLKQLLHKFYGDGDYKKQSKKLEDSI